MSIEGIDRHSIADAVSTHDPIFLLMQATCLGFKTTSIEKMQFSS